MTLTVPTDGLQEVRRVWAGRGGLWAGLGAAHDDDGLRWSPELARRRATRVVVEYLRPQLLTWPESPWKWLDALPAQSIRTRFTANAPGAGVDWVATRLDGWPPREFRHRSRRRIADSLLVTATRWTIEQLADAVVIADRIAPGVLGETAATRLAVAVEMLDMAPLASARAAIPSRSDLASLKSSGRPWASVAEVAGLLRMLEIEPALLADVPLDPDPALRDRLFHVAVFGKILLNLRSAGWTLEALGLPGSPEGGPLFRATDTSGSAWDVWFEMAGAWAYYGVPAPYPLAVTGVAGTGGALGADVALVRFKDRAALFECKFSADPTYVGRGGYEQVLDLPPVARTLDVWRRCRCRKESRCLHHTHQSSVVRRSSLPGCGRSRSRRSRRIC